MQGGYYFTTGSSFSISSPKTFHAQILGWMES